MNRVAKIAIASALSSLAFAGVSRAESLGMDTPAGIEHTLRNYNGTNFTVDEIYDHGDPNDIGGPRPFPGRSVEAKQMIRASIEANKPLVRRLNEEGVSVRNIVNADQAADGSITFYTD